MDHQSGTVWNSRSGIYDCLTERYGHFYFLWKAVTGIGRMYAVHLLCNKPDPCVLVYPQEPVSTYSQVFKEECDHCVLYSKLRSKYSCQYEGV